MYALLLASFLLASEVNYHQITWSPPQTIFGGPRSPSTVALDNWVTTFRLGEMAWSLSDAKMDGTAGAEFSFGSPAISNVVAERWHQGSP